MPVVGELARKGLTVARLGVGAFPAFSGTRGQISHTGGAATASGVRVDSPNSLRAAAIWIAVTLLADEIASLARRIVVKDDKTRTPAEPPRLAALWNEPSPMQTQFDVIASEVLSMALYGRLYEFLGWTNGGTLGRRYTLDPDVCTLHRVDDVTLELNVRGSGTLTNRADQPPQFMHVPLYSLPGRLEGVSPIEVAAELAGLSLQYQAMASRLAGRGFSPSAVLTVGEAVEDGPARALSARLENHAGSNTGRVAVVGGKDLKLERWTMSMVDAQFVEVYDAVFSILMAIWRVPPTVAGMVDKPSTWGTGVAEFSRGLERFTLRPIVLRLQAAYEKYMTGPVDPSLQFKWLFDSMLSASPRDRVEIQRTRIMSGLTSVERVLAQDDEPPFDEGETVYSQLAVGAADLNRLRAQAEVYGALVRAGVEPNAAATVAGFDPGVLPHLGLPSVTVQNDAEGGAGGQ